MMRRNETRAFASSRQAFFAGAGTIGSLYPSLPEEVLRLRERADGDAIGADWRAVGDDIRRALSSYGKRKQ